MAGHGDVEESFAILHRKDDVVVGLVGAVPAFFDGIHCDSSLA